MKLNPQDPSFQKMGSSQRSYQKSGPSGRSITEINDGRFCRRIGFITSEEDCWIWGSSCIKSRNGKKYPVLPILTPDRKEKTTYARRWAWEREYGPLEPGMSVKNLCGEELCVKPDGAHNMAVVHGDWNKIEDKVTVITAKRIPSEDEFLNTK